MENYITQLIDLGDPSAQVTDFHIEDLKKDRLYRKEGYWNAMSSLWTSHEF